MIADNGRDYKELPHLTQGDEASAPSFSPGIWAT
jgi:hypothetical protein